MNAPEGIVGQVLQSTSNAVNYVSDTLTWKTAQAKKEVGKEAGKEQAKGNVPGQDSLGGRASGAADAVSRNVYEGKLKGPAEVNRQDGCNLPKS